MKKLLSLLLTGLLLCAPIQLAQAQMVPGISNTAFLSGKKGLSCTGGVVTQTGTTRVHVFSVPTTHSLNCIGSGTASYLIVAGGGGANSGGRGGGGAGGFRTGTATLSSGTFSLVVGAGGAASTNGANSTAFGITSIGGGAGGNVSPSTGASGGSGGGAGASNPPTTVGGAGTAGQGSAGGNNTFTGNPYPAAGGGGAGAVGQNSLSSTQSGAGGAGLASSITGTSIMYAGGGGAGCSVGGCVVGAGGAGGGGAGVSTSVGTAGINGLGGGGGGGSTTGGAGGSGVVIVSYTTNSTLPTCIAGNDSFTRSMVHMDGTNGGASFPDTNQGGTAKSWTNGSTTINSSTQTRFGTASAWFGATGTITTNWLQTPIADLSPGASAFSWSGWVYNTGPTFGSVANGTQIITVFGDTNVNANGAFWLAFINTNNTFTFQFNIDSAHTPDRVTTTAIVASQGWHHLYFAFNGSNTMYASVDGVMTSAGTAGLAHSGGTGPYTIGSSYGAGTKSATYTYTLFQDEVKYDIGVVRNTSSFVPPVAPYCN